MRERSLKHERIAARLRTMVKEKIVSAGGMLPTELELGEMFSCSRGTVRRALETLVDEGLIWRRQGSGSFVRQTGTIGGQGCIGLITPLLLNTEVLRFLNEITLQAARLGYQVLLEVDDGTPTVEQCFVDELAGRHAVGVVKFPTMPELSGFESGIRARLRELNLPHVVINDFWGDPQDSNHILFDEAAAVEMAVDHLYSLGHRRIAWADTPHSCKRFYALNAFRNALTRRGLSLCDEYVFPCYAYAPMCVRDFWPERTAPPTAIVTPYDGIVRRFIEALPKVGLSVPDDVSIVNLNGQPVLSNNSAEFTCTAAPVEEMVAQAFDIILSRRATASVCRYLYPPRFMVGGTTAPYAALSKVAEA